ncbi:MAG: methionyl-tRNA formyltransferase [Pseudohongiellaceae bacterium]
MSSLRICFAGTPDFAAAHLRALLASRHKIVAVCTQPDRPAGRGRKVLASPVKRVASEAGLPVLQLGTLRSESAVDALRQLKADVFVVAAYGLILPQQILALPALGCINVHASLLPRWRGAAPVERAILAGDVESGISIMQMDEGLDTGDVLYSAPVPVAENDTRVDLENNLLRAGTGALLKVLDDLPRYQAAAQKQDNGLATYATRLDKSDALIDWDADARQVNRQIRAGVGRAPAFTWFKDGRLRILSANASASTIAAAPGTIMQVNRDGVIVACDAGTTLTIEAIQLPGKTVTTIRNFLNAHADYFVVGDVLGNASLSSNERE